ncbi:phosphonate ABC transporter, permease protein PhnE [Roseobacter sp. HKCCD9010]|jgi:phosphonate transport system permease protein|uniref:phosphonate ABC transporter, permease protein PhnE n=1 Tax=unclassified Roseobacter TaxID=196798 RepID=UPI001199EB01|nr:MULTISPECIES: phosphonate ABC transporter, permease protein PhnE [unclassified Roseobacter]MBF9051513.1 phosphonate ABC transporter, permease protein PhnE [Rhodobacterales bacterium HKCCD4356]NNV13037.1 phosphonate ABC transporter, permease protein PhnE [Roseobacter sp. HKCCD7357]NNV17288.1 phosphonate ABC transporter, permease protein PhnE [Roseobacter sp. HKCCD8768]NNV26894.1 phosphonate ABC transporter, permease protein PhnE [Roseobacter sp. HKCCD8192]NNV31014.1 phosphonate ABC transport
MSDQTALGAVGLFEKHRAELKASKRTMNLIMLAAFLVCLALSVYISQFYPERLANGIPRIFEYFGTIIPNLQWEVLFEGRTEDGRAVAGSITYWYTDFWTYVTLIWETILMAITATLIGTAVAFVLSFPAAANLAPNSWIYWISRRFLEICRGIPEILLALVFVFMIGIGPLAGVIAIAIHSAGALGKLFAEVNENASARPVEGITAVGGTWVQKMAYGVVPQVTPNFVSYALLRFEVNVRASSIIGFVGAGGIGQELNRVISFYSDDRVLAVLILVVLMVTLIDLLSERLRLGYIGRENFA